MSDKLTRPVAAHTVRTVAGTTVVMPYGEIDLVTAIPLMSLLDSLTCGPDPDLVVDLTKVTFIDCAGLAALCRTRNRVRARNGRLRLVNDDKDFPRLLRAAGLDRVFEVQPVFEIPADRSGVVPGSRAIQAVRPHVPAPTSAARP
ncbi:STAS domain-containing protein [Streptomyces griseorubiginosus]|uniref:Anti-sigma factor antagonist n=1 Tax=Streptomyces griseorubiginosus TaxID=67304 RepID=A0AAI8PRX5_9ACTN|nr:STAS domain-containing protein [Streptomyces griseorubiginosus]AYC43998.1 Anti-sigma-B factor antagonist [Streptomyces griseorubiginosus]